MEDRSVVFLDRDGTIIEDAEYSSSLADVHLLPTAPEAIKLLNQRFLIVVITNQSGIGRGLFGEGTLSQIHDEINLQLSQWDACIDFFYHCPHLPSDLCECRKPGIELFKRAAMERNIDLERSYMVGDCQIDIEAGKKIGAKTVLVPTGPEKGKVLFLSDLPSCIASDLMDAAKWIMEDSE